MVAGSRKKSVRIGPFTLGGGKSPLLLIAGPCVIEDPTLTLEIAQALKEMAENLGLILVFKASYDKANRTSLLSYRGPGMQEGLSILARIKESVRVPVTSDVHSVEEVKQAAQVLDLLQIPALLSRQTDLILAAAQRGKALNVKKGQFMAPGDMAQVANKVLSQGQKNLLFTERGTTFGYQNLVVDFRSIPIMKDLGFPVVFDATHSVQLPGAQGGKSGGEARFIFPLAAAGIAAGADGIFLEVHPRPKAARCDGPNSLPLKELPPLLARLKSIHASLIAQPAA
jgi:2-dehydro-3-deoxyphosphooctonate aldolase (KDO 8-P synthase)